MSTRTLPINVIAQVGSKPIFLDLLQEELARRAKSAPGATLAARAKDQVLDELIRFEALHQQALAAGYDRDPQVAARFQRMIVAQYQEDLLAKLGPPQITDLDIAAYYLQNQPRFGTPAKLRAALIEIKVARTASPEKRAETAPKATSPLNSPRCDFPAVPRIRITH